MAPVKHNTGEFEMPEDPGLQLVLYRLDKIEQRQEKGEIRDANVMSRLDQIVGTLNATQVSQAAGTERVNAHAREIGEVKGKLAELEDEQSGVRRILKTVTDRPTQTSSIHRRAGIDSKFWVTISTALAALCTAVAAIFGGAKDKDTERTKGTTVIEMPGSHVDRK